MIYLIIISIKAIVFVPLAMSSLALESIAALLTWDSTMIHGTSYDGLTDRDLAPCRIQFRKIFTED